MENASNALLIGAGILITILVLSIIVYAYVHYSRVNQSYEEKQNTEEIVKFNSRFTIFDSRTDITAKEIVSLENYVEKYNKENTNKIELNVKNGGSPIGIKDETNEEKNETLKIQFLKDYSVDESTTPKKIITFKCESIEIDNSTGKVKKIEFKKN